MADHYGDKSLDPTPHRRQKAREMGQVAKSQDLGSALLLLGGLATLAMLGSGLVTFLFGYAEHQLSGSWAAERLDYGVAEVVQAYYQTLAALARHVLPILGLLMLTAVVANIMQVGFLFLPQKLVPDIGRINPVNGLQRLFSLSNGSRLVLGLMKIAAVATVGGMSLYSHRNEIFALAGMEPPAMARQLVEILLWTGLEIGGVLFLLALVDYGFQRWRHEQDLKMTPQELREEMKHLEGDGQLSAQRKQRHRQLVSGHSWHAVPRADLIVRDPAGHALAISYKPLHQNTPVVVAKESGRGAQRISDLARQHEIPMFDDSRLAGVLWKDAQVDQPIPAEQYTAVAELLVRAYSLRGKDLAALSRHIGPERQ